METREHTLGIDFGTTNCSVAVLRSQSSDEVETIPFEFWLHTSPSWVAYIDNSTDSTHTDPVTVFAGQAAQDVAQTPNGAKNAVFDIKRLVGQSFDDPRVQKYMKLWPFSLVNVKGMAAVKINQKIFLPKQILTDLLTHLRTTAQGHFKTEITKAVLAVPAHFSSLHHCLVRDACADAGLKTVHLINENTAAAAYASTLCGDPPKDDDNPLVLVMDLGGTTLDLTLLKLNAEARQKFEIVAAGGDNRLGGQDFDDLLTKYCIEEFKNSGSTPTQNNVIDNETGDNQPTSWNPTGQRLRGIQMNCQTMKHNLSSSETASVLIFINDDHADLSQNQAALDIQVTPEIFENLIQGHLERCIKTLDTFLQKSKIPHESIYKVILIGGSSRIPKVAQLVKEYFGGLKEIQMAPNLDEAIAMGVAIHAHNIFSASISSVHVTDRPTESKMDAEGVTNLPNADLKEREIKLSAPPKRLLKSEIQKQIEDLRWIKELMEKHATEYEEKNSDLQDWIKQFKNLESALKNRHLNLRAKPNFQVNTHVSLEVCISQLWENPLIPHLTDVLKTLGEFEEALHLNEKIHDQLTLFDENESQSVKITSTKFKLAECHFNLKNFDKALKLFRTVFTNQSQTLGLNHKDTLKSHFCMARTLLFQNKAVQSLHILGDVYAKKKSILGPDHSDTLETQFQIALCFDYMGKYREAMDLFEHVLAKRRELLGPNHEDTIQVQIHIAVVLEDQGNVNEALDQYRVILKTCLEFLGPQHPQTLIVNESIESILTKMTCIDV